MMRLEAMGLLIACLALSEHLNLTFHTHHRILRADRTQMTVDLREQLAKRRASCIVAYLQPFRIVESDDAAQPWNVTIEEVNRQTWDYVKLHEIAGAIDVGLDNPYNLVVSRDGALALPPLSHLRSDQAAVEFFNRCLAGLLLGGVYCEAISVDSLDTGSIIDWKYLRSYRTGQASSNRFHELIRYQQASSMEAIELMYPRTVRFSQLASAMKVGLSVLSCVARLRGDLLLKGVTGIARRDWNSGLSNLWIVIEQIVSHVWDQRIVGQAVIDGAPKSRRDQLSDNRTWTVAVKLEVLHQSGFLDAAALQDLSVARKARNDLAHEGQTPSETSALAALSALRHLLGAVMPEQRIPLFDLNLSDHAISDPFAPREPRAIEPQYWMEIPKLPNELELEQLEAKARLNVPDDGGG
ncbi:hypothetical protein [Bradyrhizobium nanningense]|nr:hypothetical protein [Bradyrhizobium nanningense]